MGSFFSMMVEGYKLCDEKSTQRQKKKKERRKRGENNRRTEKKRKREVTQQVVHTARWVPGAWRGWLRYQTATHKRRWAKH